MIYSIGYSRLTPSGLARLVSELDVEAVIDVRSIPNSRRPAWAKKNLVALLGRRYEWRGDELGGRAPVTVAALDRLAKENRQRRRLMLLCLEEAPWECHRHHSIAAPLLDRGVNVGHLWLGQLVRARDLAKLILRES